MVISVSVVYHVTGICHKKLSELHKSLTSTHFMWTNTWRGVWRSTKSRLSALSCELSNINESVSVVLISFSTWEEQPPSTRPRSNSDHLGQPRNASLPSDYNVVDFRQNTYTCTCRYFYLGTVWKTAKKCNAVRFRSKFYHLVLNHLTQHCM